MIAVAVAISLEECWSHTSLLLKLSSITAASLFVISGFLSNFHLIKEPGFSIQSTELRNFISYLNEQGLNYGYGPYWGSSANAITVLSNSQIKIRPVIFDKVSGRMIVGNRAESSRRWYKTDDFPVNQEEFFVVVNNDGEECPIPQLCINGLTQQYGKPSKLLAYGKSSILVWNHPLIGWHNNNYLEIKLTQKIKFDSSNFLPAWEGWSLPEPWGTWSDGDASFVFLHLSSLPKNDLELLLEGHAFLADKHPSQEIDILMNKQYVATLKYDQQSNGGVRAVKIPKRLVLENNGHLLLKFNFKNPKSPADLGLSGDDRRLGLGIVSMELKPAD